MEVVMLGKTMLMAGTIMVSSAVVLPAYADSANTMKTDDAVKADAAEMKNDAKNEYQDAKKYSYEQKEDFMDWARSKSEALGEKYDEMKKSAADNSEDAMDTVSNTWEDAKDSLGQAMTDVQDASSETWEDVKAETIDALNKAQNALDDKPDAQ
jgi:gas vesicle protein